MNFWGICGVYFLGVLVSGFGRWSMVHGQWSMVNGRWSMVDGRWSLVHGQWSMVDGVERHFATTRPGGLPFDKLRASHSIGKGTGVLENGRECIGVVGIRTESRSISGER